MVSISALTYHESEEVDRQTVCALHLASPFKWRYVCLSAHYIAAVTQGCNGAVT